MMKSPPQGVLGVLSYDGCDMLPRGFVGNEETFNFPIAVETVKGASLDRLWARDPMVEQALIDATRRLVERGAVAVTSTCGLFVWNQDAVAASVKVPVVLSSLPLLPLMLRQVPSTSKVGLLSVSLPSPYDQDALGISGQDLDRIAYGACEGAYEQSVKTGSASSRSVEERMSALEKDVVVGAIKLMAEHPQVAAILLTCTAFPCFATALRKETRLPVYGITDLARLTMGAVT